MTTGGHHPEPPEQPELLNLVLRRGELLAQMSHSPKVGMAKAAQPVDQVAPDELSTLTQELISQLNSAPLAVRSLSLNEPGDLLHRLIQAEPVHPFSTNTLQAQDDLADRLAVDRRCFVLEHPLLHGYPLNVVWVALLDCLPSSIKQILNPSRTLLNPSEARTAAFYSIWNVEPGLAGIPGGASLLTGAMDLLRAEFRELSQLLTLSPIPGFRQWFVQQPLEVQSVSPMKACAKYLCTLGENGRPLDPVARFHLGNGARLLRIHDQADLSDQRIAQSFGIMANYSYEPEDRPAHLRSLQLGTIAVGDQIREFLL